MKKLTSRVKKSISTAKSLSQNELKSVCGGMNKTELVKAISAK